jgi:hypothetical protein
MNPTVGLFGTCGKSRWRAPFIATYEARNIPYYNPQVENWTPECAADEARHLAEDEVILFPVTGETYGTGSLAEVGFSILNAIRLDDRRDFVVLIERTLDEVLKENETAFKESMRARALVHEHLRKLRLRNVYLVDTLDEMLAVSITAYEAASLRAVLHRFNPHERAR